MVLNTFIMEKRVSGELLDFLSALGEADKSSVSSLIREINPSANTLRNLLQLAEEVAVRDDKPLHLVLGHTEIQNILLQEKLSRKEKQKKLRLMLEVLRFPEIYQIQQRLAEAEQTLLTEFDLRAELPKDLEGDSIAFRVSVREPEDAQAWAEKLSLAAKHPALIELLDLLKGKD